MRCNTQLEQVTYNSLKYLRLNMSERFVFVSTLTLKLLTLIDLLDNDTYNHNELLADIKFTIENLQNYSLNYSDMLNDYLKGNK